MENQNSLLHLPNHETKKERLQEVLDQMMDSLPVHIRTMARTLGGNYLALFQQLPDSETDNFILKIKEFIDYVEHGHH
ncbi:hypothetical protein [Bacillus sp. ISL-57]|uniref:hypothetical protein n=1 Tax=Bacillus sp. ISL-57 TaxID=2819135 RepID=UPI001BE5AA77|nr:hypothetical protein [Bacillus sp. ISL-57]